MKRNDPTDMLFVGPTPKRRRYNPRDEARKREKEYARTFTERVSHDRREQAARLYSRPASPLVINGVTVQPPTPPSRFDQRLRRLGFRSYRAYLRSALWKATKQRYRSSGFPQECFVCGSSNYELHHKTYERLGRERMEDFAPLCRPCHKAAHDLEAEGESISTAPEALRRRRAA